MPAVPLDKLPPQNLEAEASVLGAMLIEKEAIGKAIEILEAEDFYKDAHQKIFSAIVELFDNNKAVDLITVSEHLSKSGELDNAGGTSYISSLIAGVPTAANVEYYVNIVKNKSILRKLINVATEVITRCYQGGEEAAVLLDHAEQKIFDIAQTRKGRDFVSIKDIIHDSIELAEALSKKKRRVTGIPTGFYEFDEMTSGLQPSDLIIIAGRPSMGKSSFVTNIAQHVAIEEKLPLAFFSLEMSKDQLVQRMLCSEARIETSRIRKGFVGEKDWPKLNTAAGRLYDAPIWIDDSSALTALELRAKARRLKAKEDIQLIIIDYLQMMTGRTKAESRQQEIAEISRSLKSLAKELNIPVVACSQLSRAPESREGHRPRLSDLRESGAIEQDADVVAFLYRREYYEADDPEVRGKAEVIIAKQRNGPTGTLELAFVREFTRFENLSRREEESE